MILASHGIIASQIASFDADAVAFFNRVTTAGATGGGAGDFLATAFAGAGAGFGERNTLLTACRMRLPPRRSSSALSSATSSNPSE